MKTPSKRDLIGRKIVDFDARPYPDGRGGTNHDPRIVLDDGSVLIFNAQEQEGDGYGVSIIRYKAKR